MPENVNNQVPVKRNTGLLSAISLIIVATAFLSACSDKKTVQAAPPPIPVVVATAEQKSIPIELQAIGNAEAFSVVSIKSNISGEVTAVLFKEGDFVKRGQLIFTIDKRPYEAALRQAQSNLDKDIAQAANARAQAKRYEALMKEGVVAAEQGETMTTSAAAMDATVEADKAAVENAKVQLSYCSIYSPIDGRTGNVMVKRGNLVKANDNPVLLTINQIEPIYVTFTVPEQYLPEIKRFNQQRSLTVVASPPSSKTPPSSGQLSFIDNAVDQTTGTIKLKGTFVNKDHLLWPGQFLNVALDLTTNPKAIVVPSQAVQTGQQGQFVFVIKPDMTAETRTVAVTSTQSGQAVIASGIQPGERVVTDGALRLVPGSKVEFKAAVAPPNGQTRSHAELPSGGAQRLIGLGLLLWSK